MKKFLVLCIVFMSFGCVYDEIEISMNPHDVQPVFSFRYVRHPDQKVVVDSIRILEAATDRVVWELWAFDPSLIIEKKDNRFTPRNPQELPHESIKGVTLNQVTFGVIPAGFRQYFPNDDRKPTLKHGIIYVIETTSGSAGRLEFMVDRECRKVSLTPFTHDLPTFLQKDRCRGPGVTG